MKKLLITALMSSTLILSGCATTYQSSGMTGGFDEQYLEENIWRVGFSGNGYTTRETVQTYWLYRCSEIALEKGFDGFEIISNIQLTMPYTPEKLFLEDPEFKKAEYVYIPMYIDDSNKPYIEGDIRLIKKPIKEAPPRVFDAEKLKNTLEPLVKAKERCEMGNVCPHVHRYLYPNEQTQDKTI